jgi:hypothetical protein
MTLKQTIVIVCNLHLILKEIFGKRCVTHACTQVCAHADKIVVTTRKVTTLRDVLLALEPEGREKGLRINERKKKNT